ncbi:Tubulin binding cofactor C [Giardia muris]|uniref:Tubulin binding cofactor C n=1 Tax=Giardia muris TaxID=5742 RepID=A0A4Z1SLF5_GIAMU|nr:Tubulin binding cofactor C [Giardia muris]|eukprot:TNJ26476.1 Tubulin binding cofactor C [Giardia muris]
MQCCFRKHVVPLETQATGPQVLTVRQRFNEVIFPEGLFNGLNASSMEMGTGVKPAREAMLLDGLKETLIWRGPDSLRGTELRVSDCTDCLIVLLDFVGTVTVDACRRCCFVLLAVGQSTFLRDCVDCRFAISTSQLRTRGVHSCSLFLHCATDPVIESSTHLFLAPFLLILHSKYRSTLDKVLLTLSTYALRAHEKAGISPLVTRFERVYDFTPGSTENYRIVMRPSRSTGYERPPLLLLPDAYASNPVLQTPLPPGTLADEGLPPISCGLCYSLYLPINSAYRNIFGEEECFLWIPFQLASTSSHEHSAFIQELERIALWWSALVYFALAQDGLHLRQVVSSPAGKPGLRESPGFLLLYSCQNNGIQRLTEAVRRLRELDPSLPEAEPISGPELLAANDVVRSWEAAMQPTSS